MIKHVPEILLLNPPFGTVTEPYISIPVLAAYLQSQNISVAAYDLKREFYVRLLSPQRILKGLRYSQERFIELNGKSALTFSEVFEYRILLATLLEARLFKHEIRMLALPFADFSDIQNSKARNFFIRSATFPYFPSMIFPDMMFSVGSSYDPCSSADILRAGEEETAYTQLFEEIIVQELVPLYAPRIIGLSVTFTSQIIPAFQCARILKSFFPDSHITMGGACISTYFRDIQEKRLFTFLDSFIVDDGELPLKILHEELSHTIPDMKKIPGLIYLENEEVHSNLSAPPLRIEQSPPPDYTVFQLDKYLQSQDRLTISFRLSRGCSWQKCTFCRTDLPMCKNYQEPSKEQIYTQFLQVIESSGASSFFFSDESANPETLEYVSRRLLEDNIEIQWFAHTRVSAALTKERCLLYHQAGCNNIALGIESFSDRILRLMKKGITCRKIEQLLDEIGGVVPITAYMIVGFPSETEEEAEEGYQKLQALVSKGLLHNYRYNLFQIMYGADVWKHPLKYGISKLNIPEGNDLFPNILDFECSGMSREEAHQMGMRFNLPSGVFEKLIDVRGLPIDGTIIPLRYRAREIDNIVEHNSFSPLVLGRWLNELNRSREVLYPSAPRANDL